MVFRLLFPSCLCRLNLDFFSINWRNILMAACARANALGETRPIQSKKPSTYQMISILYTHSMTWHNSYTMRCLTLHSTIFIKLKFNLILFFFSSSPPLPIRLLCLLFDCCFLFYYLYYMLVQTMK